jgi:hypothetical protein
MAAARHGPPGKELRFPSSMRLDGAQSQYEHFAEGGKGIFLIVVVESCPPVHYRP